MYIDKQEEYEQNIYESIRELLELRIEVEEDGIVSDKRTEKYYFKKIYKNAKLLSPPIARSTIAEMIEAASDLKSYDPKRECSVDLKPIKEKLQIYLIKQLQKRRLTHR